MFNIVFLLLTGIVVQFELFLQYINRTDNILSAFDTPRMKTKVCNSLPSAGCKEEESSHRKKVVLSKMAACLFAVCFDCSRETKVVSQIPRHK